MFRADRMDQGCCMDADRVVGVRSRSYANPGTVPTTVEGRPTSADEPYRRSSRSFFGNRFGVRRTMLIAALACLGGLACMVTSVAVSEDEPAAKKTVRLVVDFGDGFSKQYSSLEWKEKMTVLDVMNEAKRHPRGIRFEFQGSGETGLLLAIDGLKNEGRGRNWIYRVNEQLGDRSFAIYPVAAGDVVLWKFSEYK